MPGAFARKRGIVMTKKIHILAAIIAAAYILATTTACSNGENSNSLSSDTVTTTVTDLQTPAPETTTEAATTTVTEAVTTTEKKMETSATTPAPETTQTTTTAETEAETPAPETTTTPVPETTTVAPAPETTLTPSAETVEKLDKVMYAIGAVCSYEQNTIRFSDPVDKYYANDEVRVVEKVAGMYNGKGCDEGYFYKLDDGTYVPAGFFTDNKNWQAETTFQTYDWTPDDPGVPMLPPSNQFTGDLFD